MLKRLVLVLAVAAQAALAGCSDKSGSSYLKVTGGSFIFNYRLAFAYAGVLVAAERDLPANSTVEVSFENPAGGPPIVVAEKVDHGQTQFDFTIDDLSGIKADVDYLATVRLIAADGTELERIERPYRSQIDQETTLPRKPLTIGPGYARNPEAAN